MSVVGASQVPRLEATESGTTDSNRSRLSKTQEEGVNAVSDPVTGYSVVSAGGLLLLFLKGLGPELFEGRSCPSGTSMPWMTSVRDLSYRPGAKGHSEYEYRQSGGSSQGGGVLGNIFDDVRENIDLDAPSIVEASKRFQR